jgi:two-component system OmpR family sensor kinase
MKSIQRWLLVSLMLSLLGVCLVAAYGIFVTARNEANELFDYELRTVARSLPAHLNGVNPIDTLEQGFEGISDDQIVIRTWPRGAGTAYSSVPGITLPRMNPGLHSVEYNGREWRVWDTQQYDRYVQVAQPTDVREGLAMTLAARTVWPLLALLPVVLILVFWLVGRGLRPLRQLATALGERSADTLTPLVFEPGPPAEVAPLLNALNQLLGRLDSAQKAQRTFVADAAHELRSPLTALKLQLQLSSRNGTLTGSGDIIAKLEQRLNRTIHLVSQLLTLAREDAGTALAAGSCFDLRKAAAQVVADLSILAEANKVDLGVEDVSLEPGEVVLVAGEVASFSVLIANLVDNAIRYTPAGGRIDVRVGRVGRVGRIDSGAETALLEVRDTGPGIPEHEIERVKDRFYRGENAGEGAGSGSGLGLAIASQIARRHGAQLKILNRASSEGSSGLSVTLLGLLTVKSPSA